MILKHLFNNTLREYISSELDYLIKIDQAHLLMLNKQGIIVTEKAKSILMELISLSHNNFQALENRKNTRGAFILYEDFLIEKLGAEFGGVLQTGRSRNDLKATIILMRLRPEYYKLLNSCTHLLQTIGKKAALYKKVIMPVYTNYQAAMPITYGHYLLGIGFAIERDCKKILQLSDELNVCPLGASAAGGTSFNLDCIYTARLLGFEKAVQNSIDAVASRDTILTLLSFLSISGCTLSRIASDFLIWSTNEFGFFQLPDEIVGSSSVMPNKRNPFILEHIQGKGSKIAGYLMEALSASNKTIFSNSISSGTEAMNSVWNALNEMIAAIELLDLFIEKATPVKERMYESVKSGFTFATEFANQLVRKLQISFRHAHHIVGSMITDSEGNFSIFMKQYSEYINSHLSQPINDPDIADIVRKTEYGGGPGDKSIEKQIKEFNQGLKAIKRQKSIVYKKWIESNTTLTNEIKVFLTA